METLSVNKEEGSIIVKYSGELTLEVTSRFKKEFDEIFEQKDWNNIIFDMQNISFMDSSGIGFLVSMHNKIKQKGLSFYVFKPSISVIKTLKLVKLLSFFDVLEEDIDLEYIISK